MTLPTAPRDIALTGTTQPDVPGRILRAGPAEIELVEGLEQLRFLVNGVPILCVEVPDRGRRFWELNNPSDVARIEEILSTEGTP